MSKIKLSCLPCRDVKLFFNKRNVKKCLKYVKEYSRRYDSANGKYLSIFLRVFARIVKITHLTLKITVHKVS